MRIQGPSNRNPVNRRRSGGGSGIGGAVFDAGGSPQVSSTPGFVATQAMAPLDSILALQSVDDPLLAKRKAVRHGQSLLDTLEQVKADFLIGAVSEGRLHRLMALVTRARTEADPELDALIDDIELRAKVELAKLGRIAA